MTKMQPRSFVGLIGAGRPAKPLKATTPGRVGDTTETGVGFGLARIAGER